MNKPTSSGQGLLNQALSLPIAFQLLRRRWTWLPLGMVLGAMIGLALSFILSPVYQATASLGIGIDYGRTLPLSTEAERQALLRVQELLLSDQVLLSAIDSAQDQGGFESRHSAQALRESIRIDRVDGRWDLTVYSKSPSEAAALANAWSDASTQAIEQALVAAWRVRDLQLQVYQLGCSYEYDPDLNQAVYRCQVGESEQAELLSNELIEMVEQSGGLLPAFSHAQLRSAQVPEEPVLRSRTWMIFGGLLVGFSISLVSLVTAPISLQPRDD